MGLHYKMNHSLSGKIEVKSYLVCNAKVQTAKEKQQIQKMLERLGILKSYLKKMGVERE